MPNSPKPPASMADAYKTATDPSIHVFNRALRQENWEFMMKERGKYVRLDVLDQLHPAQPVTVSTPPQPVETALPVAQPVNNIDAARLNALPATLRAIGAMFVGGKPAA